MAPRAIAPPSHSSFLTDPSLPCHSSQPSAPQRVPYLNKKGRSQANICVFRPLLALTGMGFPSGMENRPLQADSARRGLRRGWGPGLGSDPDPSWCAGLALLPLSLHSPPCLPLHLQSASPKSSLPHLKPHPPPSPNPLCLGPTHDLPDGFIQGP